MQVDIIHPKTGKSFKGVHHDGTDYVVAIKGRPFSIRLYNNCNRRRMAVVSVDGLDVMTGEPASSRAESGYVLNPWQTMEIKGWHRTNREVAQFVFDSNDKSYSAKMGKGCGQSLRRVLEPARTSRNPNPFVALNPRCYNPC